MLDPAMKIEDAPFPRRAINAFKNAGFTSVADIMKLTDAELLGAPNLGRKTIEDVRKALAVPGGAPSHEACWLCRFSRPTDSNGKLLCQRNPPVLIQEKGSWASIFVHVNRWDWCGEYQKTGSAEQAEAVELG